MTIAAVIGCGKPHAGGKEGWCIGHAHGNAWVMARPGVSLVGVDPNQDNLKLFGEKFGVPADRLFSSTADMYASLTPDHVSIATWPGLHVPLALEAVKAGVKGILLEKPVGISPAEVHAITAACRNAGVKWAVAHQRRFNPAAEAAAQWIESGKLGGGEVMEARVGDEWDMLSWSIHWMDLANYIFGSQPEWILAGIDWQGDRRYQHAVERNSVVLAQHPHKRQAVFITGPENPQTAPVVIRGEAGMLRIHESGRLDAWTKDGYKEIEPPASSVSGHTRVASELIDAVEKGTPQRCNGEDCAQATLQAFAAHRSGLERRKVSLPIDFTEAPLEGASVTPAGGN